VFGQVFGRVTGWCWPDHQGPTADHALMRFCRAVPWLALVLAPGVAYSRTTQAIITQATAAPVANPAPAAKTAPVDPALSALVPDAAVADPVHWALDTDAAHQAPDPRTLPDVTGLDQPDTMPVTDTVLGPIPGLTIAWPDSFALPPITALTPDADIAAAVGVARDAGNALDVALPRGGWRGPLGADAVVRHVAPGIDLVFPRGTVLPEMDALSDQFVALSSLRALGRGDDNLAQLSRRAHDDVALLVQILRLYGYYDAEVSENLVGLSPLADNPPPPAKGSGPVLSQATVRFEVVPGTRYRIGTIALGDVAQSANRAALITALALKSGDPANTEAILAARGRLSDALGHIGYAFAKVGDPALAVDHETQTSDLTLPVTTGGIYQFGTVTSSLPKLMNSRHLQRMARFRPGQTYDQHLVDDFRREVLATGIVGGVTIVPREATAPDATGPDATGRGVADLDVNLTKGPEHTIGAQIGLSSGQGFEVDGSWEDRNVFPPEGMLRLRAVLGTREQLGGVTFRRANFLKRDQTLDVDASVQYQVTDAYNAYFLSSTISLAKQSTLLYQKRWAYSFGVQVTATRQVVANAPAGTPFTDYYFAALPMKLAFDSSNNLLDPIRGVRIAVTLTPAVSIETGPRSPYFTTQLDASTYQPVSGTLVLAERVRVASINGAPLVDLAPSQHLFAGGGASVRGYGYQDVGPRNANNTPIGGLSVTEFSLEARIRTGLADGALSVVPFIDAGMVGETPTPTMRDAKVGVGIGVRYKTNFGPIRFDIGTPVNPAPGDSRIGVYVSLGQAF
jgi:translocation and assembly module TamA